jgi:anaerobic selenocysteine-containing dehydrogenase
MNEKSNKNKPILLIKRARYDVVPVYKNNLVKLNPNLLNTLGIHAGDLVDIFLDTEEATIVIKKSQDKGTGGGDVSR